MYVCLFCGLENPSESAKFCSECGPSKNWQNSEVDKPELVQQYVSFFKETFFDLSEYEAEALAIRARERFKISFETHRYIFNGLMEQKKSIKHLSEFKLEFDENVVDAFAGHDTYLKFRFTNISSTDLFKTALYWDDPETPDELDLNIYARSFIKPNCSLVLGGSHIFSRIGTKEITDLLITVTDQFNESATFRASSFSFKVNNPDQRVTQNISTHNQISIEGRGVVDATGMGAEKNLMTGIQSSESKWVSLNFTYVPSVENNQFFTEVIKTNENNEQKSSINLTDPNVESDELDFDELEDVAEKLVALTQSSISEHEEWLCRSPAMEEALRILSNCFDFFDSMAYGNDEEENKNYFSFYEIQLQPLLECLCKEINLCTDWMIGCGDIKGVLIQNIFSTQIDDEYEALYNFEGEATVISWIGVASIYIENNIPTCKEFLLWSDMDSSVFNMWGFSGETESVYLGSPSLNSYRHGGHWEVDDVSACQQAINNANSWINRIQSIAKGEIGRDQVLFPIDEDEDGYTDEILVMFDQTKEVSEVKNRGFWSLIKEGYKKGYESTSGKKL